MSEDELSAAVKRAYSKGYVAGQKRAQREDAAQANYMTKAVFLEQAYLAALPACIAADHWTRGEKKITSLADRVTLAADFAREALKQRPMP